MAERAIRAARRGKQALQDWLTSPETDDDEGDDAEAFVLTTGERVDPRAPWALPNQPQRDQP